MELSPDVLRAVVAGAELLLGRGDGTMAVAEIILAEAMPGVLTSSKGWSLSGDVVEGDSKGTQDSSSSKDESPGSEAAEFTTAGDIFFLFIILQVYRCVFPPGFPFPV